MKELELIKSDTTKVFETTIKTNNVRNLDQRQRKNLFLALTQVLTALESGSEKELFDQLRVLGQQLVILYPGASADHYSAIIEALRKNATSEEVTILNQIEHHLVKPVAQARLACLQIAIGDVQSEPEVADILSDDDIRMKKLDSQKMGVIFFNAFGTGDQDEMELADIAREQVALRALTSYDNNTELYRSLITTTNSKEDNFLNQAAHAKNELILKANLKILENNFHKLNSLIASTPLEKSENKNLIKMMSAAGKLLQGGGNTSTEKKNKAVVAQSKQLEMAIRRLQQKKEQIKQGEVVYRTLEQGDEIIEVGREKEENEGKEEKIAEERISPLHAALIAEGDLKKLKSLIHNAVSNEEKQLVEFLINFVDKNGKTLLHHAVLAGDMEFIELLKQNGVNGADVIAEDNEGKTPLDHAVAHNNFEMVDCLLEIMHHDMGEDVDRCHYHRYVYENNLQKVKEKLVKAEAAKPLVQELDSIDSDIKAQDPATPASSAAYIAVNSQLETLLHPEANTQSSERLTAHVKDKYGVLSGLLDRIASVVNGIVQFMQKSLSSTPQPKARTSEGLSRTLLNAAAVSIVASSSTSEESSRVRRQRLPDVSSLVAPDSPIREREQALKEPIKVDIPIQTPCYAK